MLSEKKFLWCTWVLTKITGDYRNVYKYFLKILVSNLLLSVSGHPFIIIILRGNFSAQFILLVNCFRCGFYYYRVYGIRRGRHRLPEFNLRQLTLHLVRKRERERDRKEIRVTRSSGIVCRRLVQMVGSARTNVDLVKMCVNNGAKKLSHARLMKLSPRRQFSFLSSRTRLRYPSPSVQRSSLCNSYNT